MKSRNSTLQLFGSLLKNTASIINSFYFALLISTFLLFFTLVSYAGNGTTNTSGSPLTGTESIRINLYLLHANNTTTLADGVLTEYNNLYHDSVTWEDAYKFTNINENLGLTRYGSILAVERRPIISATDTLFLRLWKTTSRNYQFEFITISLDQPGRQGFLEDAYLGTRTALALGGTTKFNFSIDGDTLSASKNRFRIVYQAGFIGSTLPVTFTSVKGYEQNNKIEIDWTVDNQINIEKYEVERSANGIDFIKVNSVAATKSGSSSGSYSWTDDNTLSVTNFYRIKSVDRDGSNKFSPIIKVTIHKTGSGSITIYPNPIKGNIINLRFNNQPKGIYQVRMISNTGQVVYYGKLPVNNSNISQTFFTNRKLSEGIYQLEIKAPDNTVSIQQAIVLE